ncbi:MAG: hypothetical protein ACUVRK_04055 [Spirochaetota bacterium]
MKSMLSQLFKTYYKQKAAIDNYVKSNKETKILYISVWDFDGTILKGDCSEGYTENEKR